jgi:hypothetical protein
LSGEANDLRNPDRIDALDENNRLRAVLTRAEATHIIESGRGVAVGRTCMKYVRLHLGVEVPFGARENLPTSAFQN